MGHRYNLFFKFRKDVESKVIFMRERHKEYAWSQCLHSAIQRNYGSWFKILSGIRPDLKIAMKPSSCSFPHTVWELAPTFSPEPLKK